MRAGQYAWVLCLGIGLASTRGNGAPAALGELRGTELLAELGKTGQSVNQPGIYAWSPEQGWRRVVIYGRRPRWSPRHDALCYWSSGRLFRAQLADGQPMPLMVPFEFFSDQVEWLPDGSGLAARASAYQSPAGATRGVYVCRLGQAAPLLATDKSLAVGRWSMSSDGQRLAFEEVDPASDLETIRALRVGQVGGTEANSLAFPELAGAVLYNPKWQPRGDLLAFQGYSPAARRQHVFLLNCRDGTLRRVAKGGVLTPPGWDERDTTRLLDWSPDGRELLVYMDSTRGNAPIYGHLGTTDDLMIVPVDNGRPVRFLGGFTGALRNWAWSADGQRIAYVRGAREVAYADSESRVQFWQRGTTPREDHRSIVELPEGLHVVDLSW